MDSLFQGYVLKTRSGKKPDKFMADQIVDAFKIPWRSAYFGVVRLIGIEASRQALKESEGNIKFFWSNVNKHREAIKWK